jgi:hypothetical protein
MRRHRFGRRSSGRKISNNRFETCRFGAALALGWSADAHGDAVVDWNTIAIDTISTASPPRPGPVGFLDIAVVQAAVYDAVQAIGGKYKPIA